MKRTMIFAALAATMISAMAQGGYKDGIDYYKADFPEEAAIILNNTIGQPDTDKALAYYYLGQVALHNGDKAAAEADFNKGLAADPANGYNKIGLGRIALMNGNEGEAEKLFKEGIGANKKDGGLYAAVARAYFDEGPTKYAKKIEKYIADGDKATKFKSADLFILRGDMVTNDPGQAAGQYETAIVTDEEMGIPTTPAAYVKYANVYFRVNPKFAIDKLIELNRKQPTSALAQRALAEKYYENNQLTRAAEEYGKYMNNPNHFERDEQRYVGLLYFGQKYDESLKWAETVLKKNPDNFYMQRMVMYDLDALKRYDMAEEAADRFFKNTPKDQLTPKDYEVKGDILSELKKYDEALATYKAGLAQFPDRTALLKALAGAYTSAGAVHTEAAARLAETDPAAAAAEQKIAEPMYKDAVAAMQKYCDTAQDVSLNDMWDLADYYKNLGLSLPEGSSERYQAAMSGIKAIDGAIEQAPNAGLLYRTKSQLYQVANATPNAEAAESYKKMIECYENAGETEKRARQIIAADMYIGQYYAAQKDVETARAYYQKALDLDPTNEALATFIKNLK